MEDEIKNQGRNFALAMAATSVLIECIDRTFETKFYDTEFKFIARKFQKKLEKVINKIFKACMTEDEKDSYEENEKNIKLICELFAGLAKMDTEEIQKLVDTI